MGDEEARIKVHGTKSQERFPDLAIFHVYFHRLLLGEVGTVHRTPLRKDYWKLHSLFVS